LSVYVIITEVPPPVIRRHTNQKKKKKKEQSNNSETHFELLFSWIHGRNRSLSNALFFCSLLIILKYEKKSSFHKRIFMRNTFDKEKE
jgi:hypothetical protein